MVPNPLDYVFYTEYKCSSFPKECSLEHFSFTFHSVLHIFLMQELQPGGRKRFFISGGLHAPYVQGLLEATSCLRRQNTGLYLRDTAGSIPRSESRELLASRRM